MIAQFDRPTKRESIDGSINSVLSRELPLPCSNQGKSLPVVHAFFTPAVLLLLPSPFLRLHLRHRCNVLASIVRDGLRLGLGLHLGEDLG
jgi:hypothetical protein